MLSDSAYVSAGTSRSKPPAPEWSLAPAPSADSVQADAAAVPPLSFVTVLTSFKCAVLVLVKVHVTVSPASSSMAPGTSVSPSELLHVALVWLHPAGSGAFSLTEYDPGAMKPLSLLSPPRSVNARGP